MFRGVLVFGRVAAADVATAQTQPQVHPTVAHLQALLAAMGLRLYALDLIEMSAILGHRVPSVWLGLLDRSLNRDADLEARVAGNRRYVNLAADIFNNAVNDIEAK